MFIKQIIEFELKGSGPQVVHVILKLVIFVTKQRSPKKIDFGVNYYLQLNILQKAMYLASASLGWFKPDI